MELEKDLLLKEAPKQVGMGSRFITIDLLRGLAIFMMTVIHTWTNVMDLSVFNSIDISNVNIFVAILGVLLFTLGHSRSLFLFLSAIIHQFNFIKSIEKGRNPESLLVRNLVKGFIMYGMGLVREGIFNPWHGSLYLYPIQIWAGTDPEGLLHSLFYSQITGMYLFETLQVIGLAIIFLTILNYIFVKLRKIKKIHWHFIFYAILTILAFTFLFATPYLQVKISNIVGWNITTGGYMSPFSSEREKFTRLIWYAIAGLEEPIFPNFFCVCFGCIVGYRLTQPKIDKKLARRWCLVALGLILLGVHYWFFVEHLSFNIWFRVSPVWFLLINQGLYLIYLFVLMRFLELRKKTNMYTYVRNSTFLRRWGLVALTVYMLQLLDLFPRKLFTMMTGLNFITNGQMNMFWSCVIMVFAAFYFDVIIRLWEKSGFLYLIILLPFLPILAMFPKTRALITWENAKKIIKKNFVFSFEWIVIFITKTISMIFTLVLSLIDVIVWAIRFKNRADNTNTWNIFTRRIITTWKNITFSRIDVDKSLYNVKPYYFIDHEIKLVMTGKL